MVVPEALPNGPVILVHLMMDERPDWTVCSGRPWKHPGENEYPHTPRMLCPACDRVTRVVRPTWTPFDHDDKTAHPLPPLEPLTTRWSGLCWVFDGFYEGVTLARWTQNGDDSTTGWWVGIAHGDDIGVTHWMPLVWPKPPRPR